jgi:predicted neuraminidase
MKFFFFFACIFTVLGFNANAQTPTFDPNAWYNLSPMYQPTKSLDVLNDGKNYNQVWLDKTQPASGQFWRITPVNGQAGFFRLTPRYQPTKSLDVLNDGRKYDKTWLDNTQDVSGQFWKITSIEGQPGFFRLSPMFQPTKSLDVFNDGKNYNQVWLDNTQNVSGQYWRISPKTVPPPPPPPPPPPTPKPVSALTFNPNVWYNLSPMYQPAKSLDVYTDGKNYSQVWLTKTKATTGQFWKITPVNGQAGFFRLTPQYPASKSLDVLNDGKNYNQAWLDNTQNTSGQFWKITAIEGQPGFFRLSPMFQPTKSLDVINDGKNYNQVWLDKTQNINGQYWMISPKAIPAPTPTPTPTPVQPPTQAMVFDQNGWYSLSPMYQPAKSLDVLNDGRNYNQVWLDKTQNVTGQFWKISPVQGQPGCFRLSPQYQPSKSLDVINDGRNYNQVWLDRTQPANGQFWKITPIEGQQGYFRLSPQYQPQKSLDVINDGKNYDQVWLDNTQNISGQYWKITRVGNIVSPPANPIFYHPGTGKISLYLDGTLRPIADKSVLTAIYGTYADALVTTNYADYFKPPYPYGPFITNSGLYVVESSGKIYLLDNKVYRQILNQEALVYYQFHKSSVRNVSRPDKPEGTPIRKP